MANACLFIGWNRPYPGKEAEAYGFLLSEGVERIEKYEKDGWFESFEAGGLTAHGGDMNGFIILKGERAKLDELRRTDDFEQFAMKMGTLVDRLGVVPGVTLEGMRAVASRNPDFLKK